jgi:hypothetical protein
MKHIYHNLFIDTFKNLDRSIEGEMKDLIKNNIEYVINLTEYQQLNVNHRIALTCNGIKSLDFFDDPELHRIKRIPPQSRSGEEISSRITIRNRIIKERSKFLLTLCGMTGNILFICNRNNVLSPLFVCLMMHLQSCNASHIDSILQDDDVVTSAKNRADIKNYLDKYKDIIYNNINEVSK